MHDITYFRNLHLGQRCFIACNGPSLNDVPFDRMQNEIFFGLNRGYLKKEMPIKYLVTCDDLIERQFRKELENFKCDAKFTYSLNGENTYKLMFTGDRPKITGDISKPIWMGHSVTNVAIQVSYYMGFDKVYIVGMNHDINYDNTRKDRGKYINEGWDQNHFDKNYFSEGIRYNHQNLEMVELGYNLGYNLFRSAGRDLYNASSQSRLLPGIIPRVRLEDIL